MQEEDCKTQQNCESRTSSPGEAPSPFQGSSSFETAADTTILKIRLTNPSFVIS